MSTQHNEWADSMADWGAANAQRFTAPQGRKEQGWPVRRCSPEAQPVIVDRVAEEYDAPEPEPMTRAESFLLILIYLASCAFVASCAWVLIWGA